MHGFGESVDPWSGFYRLSSIFWGQAHFTQFTEIGWKFLDPPATGYNEVCSLISE